MIEMNQMPKQYQYSGINTLAIQNGDEQEQLEEENW